jgi:putative nucleotidyltransferase with HDIG domain
MLDVPKPVPTNPQNPADVAEKLKTRQVELILRQVESVPTLPEVATKLLRLTTSSEVQTEEVINLIRADQSLTARILSLASRADTGLRKEARTVGKAVVLLGFEAVRSAVLSIKVFEMFGQETPEAGGLNRREFWKHCLAVACAAELLGRRVRTGIDPEELFICGLLHDIGKLALEQCLPKSYARVVQACNSQAGNIAEYERQILGLDHTVAGRRLMQQWHLPETVEQTVWLHHQPIEALPEMIAGRQAIALVQLADTLVREQRFGYSGNFTYPANSARLASELGVTAAALAETLERLPSLIEHRSRTLGMGETTTESLYRAALADANSELDRLNRRLQRRAADAAMQVKAFMLLRQFGQNLSQTDSLHDLCRLLARTWAQVGELTASAAEPVAAYVFSSADSTIVLGTDIGAPEPAIDLVPAAVPLPPEAPPENALTGSEVLERIADMKHVPDSLGQATLSHYPLVCGQRWVGGLFWSAGAAKADLAGQTAQAVSVAMAFAAAMIESRENANILAEQLAESSQRLYAAQKALTESRTLAAVGEMAAGAAHEINNPLAVIAGRAQLMAESAAAADRQTWQIVADQAQKISDIVTEMMEFARPPEPHSQSCEVKGLIDQALAAVRQVAAMSNLAVKIRVAANTPAVWADPEQILEVLTEVLMNAHAAYTANPHAQIDAGLDELAGMVVIRITDQGVGMDSDTLDKAFTPFFSQRPAGRRRGLGLTRARRFVQLAGGKMWITSAAGQGTSVFIQLPPSKDANLEQEPAP